MRWIDAKFEYYTTRYTRFPSTTRKTNLQFHSFTVIPTYWYCYHFTLFVCRQIIYRFCMH